MRSTKILRPLVLVATLLEALLFATACTKQPKVDVRKLQQASPRFSADQVSVVAHYCKNLPQARVKEDLGDAIVEVDAVVWPSFHGADDSSVHEKLKDNKSGWEFFALDLAPSTDAADETAECDIPLDQASEVAALHIGSHVRVKGHFNDCDAQGGGLFNLRPCVVLPATSSAASPRAAYDKKRCEPILNDEKDPMSSCLKFRCGQYAVGAPGADASRHAACMDECASKRSPSYQECYSALVQEGGATP